MNIKFSILGSENNFNISGNNKHVDMFHKLEKLLFSRILKLGCGFKTTYNWIVYMKKKNKSRLCNFLVKSKKSYPNFIIIKNVLIYDVLKKLTSNFEKLEILRPLNSIKQFQVENDLSAKSIDCSERFELESWNLTSKEELINPYLCGKFNLIYSEFV